MDDELDIYYCPIASAPCYDKDDCEKCEDYIAFNAYWENYDKNLDREL